MSNLSERMIGAATLQSKIYEEVEADTSATPQAIAVVVLASLASGVGVLGTLGLSGALKSVMASLLGWVIWVALIYLIGTKLLPEPQTKSDMGELLRTTGFAYTPGILRIVSIIPIIGWLISFAIFFWMLATMVIAVRQALDYKSTGRAVAVCIVGFIANVLIGFVLGGLSLL